MSDAWREIIGGNNVQPISKKGTRWPQHERIPEEWIALGYTLRREAKLPRINLRLEADKFVDYWTSTTGSHAYKLNWLATWRNWCRTARGNPEPEPIERSTSPDDMSIRRVKAALAGARSAHLDANDVRLALARGAITQEEARRLGF